MARFVPRLPLPTRERPTGRPNRSTSPPETDARGLEYEFRQRNCGREFVRSGCGRLATRKRFLTSIFLELFAKKPCRRIFLGRIDDAREGVKTCDPNAGEGCAVHGHIFLRPSGAGSAAGSFRLRCADPFANSKAGGWLFYFRINTIRRARDLYF